MIVPGSANALLLSQSGYDVPYSLRFRRANNAAMTRTAGTPTNAKIATWSFWHKRGALGGEWVWGESTGGASTFFTFDSVAPDTIRIQVRGANLTSTPVFRDPSAWYHFVVAVDTTQATAADRIKVYANNQAVTMSGTITLNADITFNESGKSIKISNGAGWFADSRDYIDGYLAEFNFIDGQALTPSSFGQTDSATGVWVPKKYSGTYGNNGFYLKFADASAATATAIGKDSSGNGNNWTPSGISVTSGVTFDQSTDTPTLGYPVISPINSQATVTISEANMASNYGGASNTGTALVSIPFPTTGKWYYEHTCIAVGSFDYFAGVVLNRSAAGVTGNIVVPGTSANEYAYRFNGEKMIAGVTSAYGSSYTANDVIGVAFDADNLTIQFYKNNVAQGLISSMPAGQYVAFTLQYGGGSTKINFGQRPFSYTPPTGFKALNTANLPTPSIKKGGLYMDVKTWTATGTDPVVISGLGFSPDLVWAKARNDSYNNVLVDKIRGVNNVLSSNLTNAEATYTTVTQFNSDGFNAGGTANNNFSLNCTVTVPRNYVAWTWKEGATPGFDIVAYTGTGSALNVSHALGAVPKFMVIKAKDNTVADNWGVYHGSLPNTQNLYLNLTNAAATASMWNSTTPTSSVFTVGANNDVNRSGRNYISYLWSEIEGFSKFGSYTGNGSTDGPFVWCGHRPRYVLIKSTGVENWSVQDSARNSYNVVDARLKPNSSDAEAVSSVQNVDFLSNGFKIRTTDTEKNGSGTTYIFAAFAENPFKYARAR